MGAFGLPRRMAEHLLVPLPSIFLILQTDMSIGYPGVVDAGIDLRVDTVTHSGKGARATDWGWTFLPST